MSYDPYSTDPLGYPSSMGAALTPMSMVSMPYWYDASGEKHVSYTFSYGPHAGKVCTCEECQKINTEFENRATQMAIKDKIYNSAYETMSRYGGYSRNPTPGQIDANTACQIMVQFAMKHVLDYQQEMVKKLHNIQREHATQINYLSQQYRIQNAKPAPKKQQVEGRLFREASDV